ncbi:unnamed protein product [Protopolystoma xenopodis]|uniref:Uncharacterized protein n=1 Tax=Protopolystoma xenopodis TaxID=117903 RepID=A0A448XKS8_9PLAT|nr:unnamed protein product [Protopolystoma xenopodis]
MVWNRLIRVSHPKSLASAARTILAAARLQSFAAHLPFGEIICPILPHNLTIPPKLGRATGGGELFARLDPSTGCIELAKVAILIMHAEEITQPDPDRPLLPLELISSNRTSPLNGWSGISTCYACAMPSFWVAFESELLNRSQRPRR